MRKSNWLAYLIVTVTLAALSGCGSGSSGDGDDFDFGVFAPASDDVIGSGVVEEEDRPVSGFTRVVLAGIGILRIKQGTAEELIVTADDNILPHILTTVQGGTLEIRKSNVSLDPSRPIEYDLTVVALESVVLSGAGDIMVSDLMTNVLALTLSGVGKVEVTTLDADELDVAFSGVGNVDIAGTVNVQRVDVTGVGEYDARDLTSLDAVISIVGNVNQTATVRVSDTLKVTITGNGTVFYIGDPVVDDVTGSGNVQKISG